MGKRFHGFTQVAGCTVLVENCGVTADPQVIAGSGFSAESAVSVDVTSSDDLVAANPSNPSADLVAANRGTGGAGRVENR
jgi:hypothetical protein